MKTFVYAAIILLALAHQDCWWWDNSETLVFGFLPIGLAYHAGISIAAAILWALAVKYCWPEAVDVLDNPTTDPALTPGARR
ncbi:MAG: DUF3311 domain-containing protein [Phycisphaerae bacterium]|jgi:hypothetical protein